MDPDTPRETVRVDKWLWAVRIFKTRSLASQACRLNQIRINDRAVKPSRLVRVGDTLSVEKGALTRLLRVKECLHRRIGASEVANFLEDLTTPEALEKAREAREASRRNRVYEGDEGGRPSKRNRRQMEAFESQECASE